MGETQGVKALRLHGSKDLRLHDEAEPVPGEGEVLLNVSAVGLCGSDRHWLLEGAIGDAAVSEPLVLGHEIVATIASGPRAGERVVVDPAQPCRRCAPCLAGQGNLCPDIRFAGHGSTDGALRTAMAWPERLVHRVPDSLPDIDASLLEPLGVALHAFDLGQVRPGTGAAVFGCGPIGLLLIQLLRMVGASVFATDPLQHRAEAAAALGAVRTSVDEVEVAFEVADDASGLESAVHAVRPGGRVVSVGIPRGDRTSFTASTARRKGLTILLSRRMQAADLPRAIRLAQEGQVALAPLVTGRYALADWRAAFDDLVEQRGLKTVIDLQAAMSGAANG